MQRVASDVPCGLEFGCDYWQATVDTSKLGTLYYRFIVRDGSRTVYYEDDSDVRDGGWGRATDNSPDWGWAMTIYQPSSLTSANWQPMPWCSQPAIESRSTSSLSRQTVAPASSRRIWRPAAD